MWKENLWCPLRIFSEVSLQFHQSHGLGSSVRWLLWVTAKAQLLNCFPLCIFTVSKSPPPTWNTEQAVTQNLGQLRVEDGTGRRDTTGSLPCFPGATPEPNAERGPKWQIVTLLTFVTYTAVFMCWIACDCGCLKDGSGRKRCCLGMPPGCPRPLSSEHMS